MNNSHSNKIALLLLFLLSMDFLHASNLIFLTLFVFTFLRNIKNEKKFKSRLDFIILIFFSLSYFLIYSLSDHRLIENIVYYLIGPIGLYLLGGQLLSTSSYKNRQFINIILLIALGYLIHGALNMYENISNNYFLYSTEVVIDFWSKNGILRTLQGMYFTIVSSLLFVAVFIKGEEITRFWRVIIIIGTLFSFWSTFLLGNRTLMVIASLTFFYSGIIYIVSTKKVSAVVKLFLFFLAVFLLFIFNIGGLQSRFFESSLLERFNNSGESMFASARWDYYLVFLHTFYKYPFGVNLVGYDILNFPFMHNVWLDVYIQVGAMPFVFFVFFTVFILKNLLKVLRSPRISLVLKVSITSVFIAILANFMVEPIIGANIYFFMIFCLLAGALRAFLETINDNG